MVLQRLVCAVLRVCLCTGTHAPRNEHPLTAVESRFQQAGSLARPGVIGRVVRLLLGAACLYFAWVLVSDGADIARPSGWSRDAGFWFGVFAGLYLTSYVVNIGFTLDLGRWPQFVVVTLGIGFAALGRVTEGAPWTPLLAWFLVGWLLYVYTHLGASFVLSALLATPGCEMRAIPHLLGVLRGRSASEHFCPGPLRWVDEWELGRSKQ